MGRTAERPPQRGFRMDGLTYFPTETAHGMNHAALSFDSAPTQCTLASPIAARGTGLHSGRAVEVRLVPAPAHHGIHFLRTDLGVAFPARFDTVVDTRLCTVVAHPTQPQARVGTVEHLMAALAAAGIDNLVIEVDGPELPVLDGSSEPWLFLLDCAGRDAQDTPRATIEVLRTVRVEEGDAYAELRPTDHGFSLALSIDFDCAAIGHQAMVLEMGSESFRRELSRARTFVQAHEIAGLKRAGLAQGGSLANAIVVDGADVLNPEGLRAPDEFVRHKMLDAVGDLALGGRLQGRFVGHRSGHALNNRVLRALFADPANYRVLGADPLPERAAA